MQENIEMCMRGSMEDIASKIELICENLFWILHLINNNFELVNTFYRKREEHLITFNGENTRTLIDDCMTRRKDFNSCKNCVVTIELLDNST